MRIKAVEIVLRKDGMFHWRGKKIEAVKPGNGYGVMVILKPSQIDKDFGVFVWFPSVEELEEIKEKMDKSDELTYKMRGRGWAGKRPFWKLQDFM